MQVYPIPYCFYLGIVESVGPNRLGREPGAVGSGGILAYRPGDVIGDPDTGYTAFD